MNVTLTLSVEQTNLILQALGQLPYAQVSTLVTQIVTTAEEQLTPKEQHDQA